MKVFIRIGSTSVLLLGFVLFGHREALRAHAASPPPQCLASGTNTSNCSIDETSGLTFSPNSVTIAQGVTVTWVNTSSFPHTTTSDSGVWDSGNMNSGDSYYHTFDATGAFAYHCTYHASFGMTGTITVVASPAQNQRVNILPGWNLIDVPVGQSTSLHASDLLLSMNNSLGSTTAVTALATYASGRFVLYVPAFTGDQTLQSTAGVFALSTVPGSWTASGFAYPTGRPTTLGPGWNLVGAPYPSAGLTPQNIVSEVQSQAGGAATVSEVARYDTASNMYLTYAPGAGSNTLTQVPATSGMWILCQCTGTQVWYPA